MNVPRFPRHRKGDGEDASATEERAQPTVIELDRESLEGMSAIFAAPQWLRNFGIAAWLLVAVSLLIAGLIALIGATSEITMPVLAAFVVASVAAPVVRWLQRHRIPRAAGAALTLLALIALGVLIVVLVVGGITSQSGEIGSTASAAVDKAQSWLEDAGVSSSGASSAGDTAESGVQDSLSTLFHGIASGILGLTSLALGLSFAALSLFFLLKDGPMMRAWVNGHMGVPVPVADTITRNVVVSLRGYFAGVTIVAAFNGIVVGLAAWALGVPLAGTIAVVSFVTAYIPYIGAFVAGAFAVVLALGSEGTTTAIIMLVVVLLANGLLQNILQPIAFGATLGLNPLVVLIVTIGAGCLFGMVGLVLAAPLTSAGVRILSSLASARTAAEAEAAEADVLEPEPA
jgi:predicted PurR-regulated permease PerM